MAGINRRRAATGCLWIAGATIFLALAVHLFLVWRFESGAEAVARKMAAKGYPETVEDIYASHNSADPATNGALSVRRALGLINDSGVYLDIVPVMSGYEWPLPPARVPQDSLYEMRLMVSQNRAALDLVADGVRTEEFLYPLVLNTTHAIASNDLMNVLQLTRLASVQCLERAESGDIESAIRSVETALLIGERISEQPTVEAYLVGHALIGIGQYAGVTLLEHGYIDTPERLIQMAAAFENVKSADPVYAVWCDAVLSEGPIARRPTPAKSWGQIVGAVDPMREILQYFEPAVYRNTPIGYLDRRDNRREILAMANILADPDRPLVESIAAVRNLQRPGGYLERARAMSSAPSNSIRTGIITVSGLTRTRLGSAAMAARVLKFRLEHGRLPDEREFETELNPPRDPFDRELLRYRRRPDGFIVYGVGMNGVDDGGRLHGYDERDEHADEGVIIRLPRYRE